MNLFNYNLFALFNSLLLDRFVFSVHINHVQCSYKFLIEDLLPSQVHTGAYMNSFNTPVTTYFFLVTNICYTTFRVNNLLISKSNL